MDQEEPIQASQLLTAIISIIIVIMVFGSTTILNGAAWATGTTGDKGVVTLAVKNCPAGATRDTLKEKDCHAASLDFDAELTYQRGTQTLSLDDAEIHGGKYVWKGLPVAPSTGTGLGDAYVYRITETSLPEGYKDYLVGGADALGPDDQLPTTFLFRLDVEHPKAALTIYNFVEQPPNIDPATVTIYAAVCPPGYTGDSHEAYEIACEPTPTVGVAFRAARLREKVRFGHVFDLEKTGEDGLVELTAVRSLRQGGIYIGEDLTYPFDQTADTVAVCVDEQDQRIDVTPIETGVVELPLKLGDAIRCDWFNIPAS